MKILFLSDDFPPTSFGGAGISTYELALGMKKAGQEVLVITTCRKKEEAGELEYQGLKIFKIASDYPGKWRAYISLYNPPVIRELEKILKKIKPDVVHANNIHFYLSYPSIKLAKTYSKVTVVTLRDTMSFSFGKLKTEKYLKNFDAHLTWLDQLKQARKRWNPLRNLIIKYYLGYADKKFAVSKALKKALEQNGIKNVEVIHTGTDIAEWQVLPDKVKSFKKRHGLEEKKVIFFSGRLSISKGANVTFEVIEKISQEFPDVILLVAGTGSNIKERNNLKFTGWIDREEIKLAYAASDVVLVPSLYLDPFPRVVIEAMAAGKPVVGTCYGGTPEAILDGVTGFVVNPFNTKEMAEKTLDLLRDSDKARRFGKAGRERVRNTFNLDEKIKNILACYYREFGIK
ncbi:MAG: Glycosyl transferase group 1 [Parcubacteria group bacterium GW2011_GWF2_44_8b]|nr:MAG: Glycosyl transferase group 1 [Parcubacteria group bacterium GW2011_GWF2_44_8b]